MASTKFLTFEDFYGRYQSDGKTELSRLLQLADTIKKWSQDRASNFTEVVKELSIQDVQALRKLIDDEVSSIGIDQPSIVTDQILFLIIGAVKVEAQRNSSATWPLVNQTIEELISPRKKQNSFMLLSLFGSVLIVGLAATLFSINNKNTDSTVLNTLEVTQNMPINQMGSKTVDSLINVYNKMQSGECQLPQALVLQPKDREAFIAFVTEGTVTINTAESLKKSLEHADCNYPQKLMKNPLNLSKENG